VLPLQRVRRFRKGHQNPDDEINPSGFFADSSYIVPAEPERFFRNLESAKGGFNRPSESAQEKRA
jgi:hypothetical protein